MVQLWTRPLSASSLEQRHPSRNATISTISGLLEIFPNEFNVTLALNKVGHKDKRLALFLKCKKIRIGGDIVDLGITDPAVKLHWSRKSLCGMKVP